METSFVFCADATSDPEGRLNITGVYNELYAPGFPARQDRLVLAGIVTWDSGELGQIPFQIDLMDPSGKSVFTVEGHTEVSARSDSDAPPKTQLILPMEKVTFDAPGRYRATIRINDEDLNGPSLYVLRTPESQN